jgi:tetratricopeptide (TPR) repeat protein
MKNIVLMSLIAILLLSACATTRQKLTPQSNLDLKSANVYYQQKDNEKSLEKALFLYERVLKDNPEHVIALKRSADLNLFFATQIEPKKLEKDGKVDYQNMTNANKAMEFFEITYHKYDAVLRVLATFEKLTEDDRAMRRDSQKKKESCWVRMFKIGQYQFDNKMYDDAIKSIETVSKMEPARTEPYRMLIAVYQETKNDAKVEQYIKKVLETNPDDIDLQNMIGSMYYNNEEYDKAIVYFDKIMKARPLDINNMLLLSSCYTEKKDYPTALTILEKVLKLEPQNKDALVSAKLLARASDNKTAEIDYMKRLLPLDSSVEFLEEYCLRMNALEQFEGLMPYAEMWYAKDPTSKGAITLCIFLAGKMGRKDLEKKYSDIYKTLQ